MCLAIIFYISYAVLTHTFIVKFLGLVSASVDDTETAVSGQQDTGSSRGVYAWGILRLMKYRPDYTYDIYFLIENGGEKKYIDTGVTLG